MDFKGCDNLDINFKLPANICDDIYIVENYNQYYDKCKFYITKYDTKIVIKKYIVEGFIVDEYGIFFAEDSWDGWNKLSVYHELTLEEYGDCKIFLNELDALDFVGSVLKR